MPPKKDTIGRLISQRNMGTANIDRIKQLINDTGHSMSAEELQCRLDIFENYFQQVLDHQSAIEENEYDPETLNSSEIRGRLEETYCQVKSKIMSLMSSLQCKVVPESIKSSHSNLPKMKLPQFSGKYGEYPNFKKLFTALVDNNLQLTPIEKYNHLVSCLTGAALRVVTALDVTENNYQTALTLLESRFDNKYLMCEEHIKELFELKPIQKGSAEQLRRLVDTVTARFNGLCALSNFEQIANAIMVHLAVSCLDADSRDKVDEAVDYTKTFSWADCVAVLNKQCQKLEKRSDKLPNCDSKSARQRIDRKAVSLTVFTTKCDYCKQGDHLIWKCQKFLALSPVQRYEVTKKAQLCINCLSGNHTAKQCKASTCKQCKEPHNTLLHFDKPNYNNNNSKISSSTSHVNIKTYDESNIGNSSSNQAGPSTVMVSQQCDHTKDRTILATAVVQIIDKYGKKHFARALLDSASQLNFMTKNLFQKLDLDTIKMTTVITGIGEANTTSNLSTQATIHSCSSRFESNLSFVVLATISGTQPDSKINIDDWNIPSNLQLADRLFNVPQRVDLLLGADIFFQLFDGQRVHLGADCPSMYHTELGWIVSGKCSSSPGKMRSLISSSVKVTTDFELGTLVKQFWEMEKVPDANRKWSKEQTACEAHFQKHIKRDGSGHFVVKLPFKIEPTQNLGDSKYMATRRFYSLERRLKNDSGLKAAYADFLEKYEEEGHMEQIPWPTSTDGYFFMPHHCVLRPDKSTTKLRVVFDASAKSTTNTSLNDTLMVGPVVQRDLFEILLCFRLHKYGLMADVTAMYRQIFVYPEDCKFQNIVWRRNQQDELKLFALKTVTYGTASAPYLATRCLRQLADEHSKSSPVASKIIQNDFYVDDLITGGSSLEEIEAIKSNVSSILLQAKFNLRKWYSNHQQFLNAIPEDEREKTIKINDSEVVKALGIMWDAEGDNFKFNYVVSGDNNNTPITKRKVLSELSKLFDPIGLIKPLIVKAKVFLQELWIKNFDWDDPIPADLSQAWIKFADQLSQLNNVKVPRCVLNPESSVEIHGFADASSRAYGCCLYVRCTDSLGNISVNLYTSKSKVAPISTVRSLPCLELCAAHLLVQLYDKIRKVLQCTNVYLWSDSIIVLGWIAEHASNLNTFVANRVSFIQEVAADIKWSYVPSASNPADIVSRGATVEELQSSIWYSGPSFLKLPPANWPKHPKGTSSSNLPERKVQKSVLVGIHQKNCILDYIYSVSNYKNICIRFAYVRRFVKNSRCRKHRATFDLQRVTAEEFDQAFLWIISMIQHNHYKSEIDQLKMGKPVPHSSALKSLNPFLENDHGISLLKVGGRLKNANLPYEAKCPMIVPKKNPFIDIYVKHLHLSTLHAGPQVLVGAIRQRFWLIGCREYARKTVQNCVHCFKYRPKLQLQLMGNLPKDRVQPIKPFSYCGVDFCGPVITTFRIRGQKKYKSYIAVFVCFVTRAVHLEVVSDLSSEAFIAALKRFVGRRGLSKTIYCDNATNFVGARNVLKEFKEAFLEKQAQQQIITWCTANDIEFKHIPPRAPHFGGIWEAAVKSAKTILYKALQSSVLTFEELSTLIAQIEGILNSRPLTALSTDPSDEGALTPAHFLNQSRAECIIEPEADFEKISCYKHWQQISVLHQHFWNRWSREYLTTLQHRRKWDTNLPNIEIGTLVMIHDDNLPPQKWMIGRITQVFEGQDGKVRVAEIKSHGSFFRRPITKLAALPVDPSTVETP